MLINLMMKVEISHVFFQDLIDDENNGVGWNQTNQIWLQTCIETNKAMIFHYMSSHIHEFKNVFGTSVIKHDCPDHHKRIGRCRCNYYVEQQLPFETVEATKMFQTVVAPSAFFIFQQITKYMIALLTEKREAESPLNSD